MHKAFDAHLHLSESDDDLLIHYARKSGLRYTLDELLDLMEKSGVSGGLLLSSTLEGGAPVPNEEVLRLCRMSKSRLVPGLTVEPSKPAVASAIHLAEQNRKTVRAFKIRLGYTSAFADDPVFHGLYDFAEAEGLPVMFHTGDTATTNGDLTRSHPLTLDRVANKREEMTIVICHFGNPWFDDVAELVYKHPRVYADISGLSTGGGAYARRFASWLARRITDAIYFAGGAEKVIFGSDYPVSRPSDALNLVRLLDVSGKDRERILWRNAKEVYHV